VLEAADAEFELAMGGLIPGVPLVAAVVAPLGGAFVEGGVTVVDIALAGTPVAAPEPLPPGGARPTLAEPLGRVDVPVEVIEGSAPGGKLLAAELAAAGSLEALFEQPTSALKKGRNRRRWRRCTGQGSLGAAKLGYCLLHAGAPPPALGKTRKPTELRE
jgi:hypothetical protein